ncbi:MAG: hypothetical protein ISR48_09280 [Alphaproteobacteria bacterium]|nr:hypothetical protein [Alphaproteobacteria bacterium]
MSTESNKTPKSDGLSRRDALARLGLAATVAYAAPTLLQLKGASARSSGGTGGGSRSSRGSGRHSRGRRRRGRH